MTVKTYQSLNEVDKTTWNAVVRKDNLISSWEHLLAVEESGINDCKYRYVMLYDNEKPVANACFYYISFDLDIFNKGTAKKVIYFIRKHFYSLFLRLRVIECGTPTALGNTVNWLPGQDHLKVFEAVVEQMKLFAREMKVKILILRDFITDELPVSDSLLKLSFKRVGILPNSYFINNWKNFNDYKTDLSSKYKNIVNKYSKVLEEKSVEITFSNEYEDKAERLLELWNNCYEHAKEYQREVLTKEYFINLSRRMKGETKLIELKKDGKTIGFSLLIYDETILHFLFVGIDYDYVKDYLLVFNLYIQTIKFGIELGIKMIDMGLTTTYEKMEFGAEAVPFFGYMRHLSPVSNILLTNLFSLFSETNRFSAKRVYNRRFYERIYVNTQIEAEQNSNSTGVLLRDISLSGAQIETETNVKHKKILLKFSSSNKLNNFSVPAKVRWQFKKGAVYTLGLSFIFKDKTVEGKLSHFLLSFNSD